MARINQIQREAPRFEQFIQRDPVHAGRFHRHHIHTTLREPLRQAFQILRETRELPHRRLIRIRTNRHEVAPRPNINPRRIGVCYLQRLRSYTICHFVTPPTSTGNNAALVWVRCLTQSPIRDVRSLGLTSVVYVTHDHAPLRAHTAPGKNRSSPARHLKITMTSVSSGRPAAFPAARWAPLLKYGSDTQKSGY